jgi:hypothetical protein
MAVGSDACTVTGHSVRRMSFIELPPRPESVACARRLAAASLRDWDLAGLTDDAQLIVSELVTNAVTASAALPARPMLSLLLIAGQRSLRIEVQDSSPRDIDPHEAGPGAEHGRGSAVIAAFSSRWGAERTGPGDRKTVWAELAMPGASGKLSAAG